MIIWEPDTTPHMPQPWKFLAGAAIFCIIADAICNRQGSALAIALVIAAALFGLIFGVLMVADAIAWGAPTPEEREDQ